MDDLVVDAVGGSPRAGVVLFRGGALRRGRPADLERHCHALAGHGILAVSSGYRLLDRDAGSIDDCLADVREAVRRFLALARERGLDPSRTASGGSSAGAHLAMVAAATGPVDDSTPGGVVAMNPAGFVLTRLPACEQRALAADVGIPVERLGQFSLTDLVRRDLPATLVLHGTDDEVEPIEAVRRFRTAMVEAGNRCLLREYAGAGHGFHHRREEGFFDDVIATTARFLLDADGTTGRGVASSSP